MERMSISAAVDPGFDYRLGQTNDLKIGVQFPCLTFSIRRGSVESKSCHWERHLTGFPHF